MAALQTVQESVNPGKTAPARNRAVRISRSLKLAAPTTIFSVTLLLPWRKCAARSLRARTAGRQEAGGYGMSVAWGTGSRDVPRSTCGSRGHSNRT